MRLSLWLTAGVALAATALALAAAWAWLTPSGPPLAAASFSLTRLTPNADGRDDVTVVRYRLRRPATVSIYLLDAAGRRFDFRNAKARQAGSNEVLFSGIVDPFRLPDDTFAGEVLARVLPDGAYTWVIEAVDEAGQQNQVTGALTVAEADTALPELSNLSVSPQLFTPNQDGLGDRVIINVGLSKAVNADGLRLSLSRADGSGTALPLAESADSLKLPGEAGLHTYDYDGGIDLGQEPPADGDYVVTARAEDRLGQKTLITTTLTLARGGLPRAEIHLGEVQYSATEAVLFGQTLYFTLTVYNYGTAPIRTTGPAAGFVYDSMSVNYNTLGEYVEAGAFRVGLMCDTCASDYPWRWAIGRPEDLTLIPDDQGRPQYYLMPGQRALVTGGVTLDEVVPARNPQYFWAGLIHEEVEIAAVNNRVDPRYIKIEQP
ncbi:MAG: hypothetical protein JNK29_09620 [Anaerolineales bacterium]|nr:hypothetical protein [Anaerolineales bacterium]